MKNETYYTAQSSTGKRLEILTNWHGGHFDEATFERLEAIANNATINYYNKGGIKFAAGDKPRSGADMYDCMPYTDTSDFAAAWAVNWDCRSTTRPAYQLKGVALARVSDFPEVLPRAVLYWHDGTGADVFEVVGDELPTVEELAAARARNSAELVAARVACDKISDAMSALPWGAKMSEADKAELRRLVSELDKAAALRDYLDDVGKVLRHDYRAALAARAVPVLADIFTRYAGRQFGDKTAARMREELKAAAGCTFTLHRSTLSARSWSLSLAAVNAAGYTSADGEAVDIWNDAPGGGYSADLVNNSNTIQATTANQLHPPRSLATVYAWTGEKVAEIRAAFAAAEKARDNYNKTIEQYTAAKVDGFADFQKSY